MKLRKFSLLNRIYHGGLRRAKEFYIETATRLGIFNRRPSFESSLRPGVTLATIGDWGKGQKFFIERDTKEQVVAFLKKIAPETPDLLVAEADRNCAHIFDLLGSGPTSLGDEIDWHVDFKTGHRWNPKIFYKRIRPAPYPGGYDIKVPWELSRCQHLIRLGQAYWITGDEQYAREFVAQIEDWIESNPWPWGVNWTCTMDVAIRVVNWLWGYHFFKGSPSLSDEFLLTFYNSLLVHGCHIRRNLENQGGLTNNHYLADLVGLIYLGILCPEFKEAAEWRELGLRELWQEMFKQVYADGVTFEASIAYHRLTTELLLSPILLCRRNNMPVPDEVMTRLEKMLEFVMYYTKPDGTVPLIGDCDNGRLHRLNVWTNPEREWIDHRYLLALGAVLYQRNDFAQAAGDQWQEALWLLGEQAISFKEAYDQKKLPPQNLGSKAFSSGGIYLMRNDDLYMIVDAGANGQNGNGGHAHNDTLSFELFAYNSSSIIDPGTYGYTGDWSARQRFRSTAFHNSLIVDGEEINRMDQRSLFRLNQDANCTINQWISNDQFDLFDGQHTGYCRLDSPILHRRQIYFDKINKLWMIMDQLIGQELHRFDLYLHFSSVELVRLDDSFDFYARSPSGVNLFVFIVDGDVDALTMEDGFVSYCYGSCQVAPVAHYQRIAEAPIDYVFCLYPVQDVETVDLKRIKRRLLPIWRKFQKS